MMITSEFLAYFLHIASEVIPAFLIAVVFAAFVDEYLPDSFIENYFKKSHFLTIFQASFLGSLIPICTCGMIPLAFKLLKKGLNWRIMTAFLISGAACSLPALYLTTLISWDITIMRFLASVIFGVITTYFLSIFAGKDFVLELKRIPGHSCCASEKAKKAFKDRLKRIFKDFKMMAKEFLPWIAIAITVASIFHFYHSDISEMALFKTFSTDLFLGPLIGSMIGFPFYLCAGADVPLSKEFVSNAIPTGTVMAFMTAAPGVNLTSLLIYKQCIGVYKAAAFVISSILMASAIGIAINLFF